VEKSEKKAMVEYLSAQFSKAQAAFLTDYRGLDVEKLSSLRNALEEQDAEYRVVKNTLAKIAAKGTIVEACSEYLQGPNAMALVYGDPAAAAKALVDFAKQEDKLVVKGGVLGDGINSAIAAIFNTFPNTTFSQNNGVIQMTGVASRYVGMYLAGFLVILGLFPVIGGFFRSLPNPVLGGATIVMFGAVAAAGVNIIASMGRLGRREILIIAVSLGIGLGLAFVPEVLSQTPKAIQQIFGSAITSGGLAALILNMVLPQNES